MITDLSTTRSAPLERVRHSLLLALVQLLAVCSLGQPAPAPTNQVVRFRTVDLLADTQAEPLAAYQLEFSAQGGQTKIVGIEGGEHPAFRSPPYYDPKAIQHERVILAAFSTAPADQLPTGKTRVATLHLQTSGADPPRWTARLMTAATVSGRKIHLTLTAQERKSP
ncbi:MAG: hypothetical protein FJ387_08875 [Verrucomicrobia bacterium]|nr:hypothetical protein [Verrucomicrobiota bacterium]